jgi:uncharacterized membrane protein YhaH (DUF805 family)
MFLALAALLLALTLIYRRALPALGWTGWIVYPALLFCAACILCKRLHDRGRAGWWAGLVLLAVWTASWPTQYGWQAAVFLIAVVDLGLWPGQKGGNRFGPEVGSPSAGARQFP